MKIVAPTIILYTTQHDLMCVCALALARGRAMCYVCRVRAVQSAVCMLLFFMAYVLWVCMGDRVLAIDTNEFQKSLWNLVDE
jgi:hypothetical protein